MVSSISNPLAVEKNMDIVEHLSDLKDQIDNFDFDNPEAYNDLDSISEKVVSFLENKISSATRKIKTKLKR